MMITEWEDGEDLNKPNRGLVYHQIYYCMNSPSCSYHFIIVDLCKFDLIEQYGIRPLVILLYTCVCVHVCF